MIANKSNKAIVLIATIATLAVISVILMFFAQSSIFERQLTSNNNLERQAKLVATASIEWAASYIPKLAMGADDGDSSVSNKAYSSVADFYQFKVINNNESGKYDPHCPVEEHYLAPDSSKKIERGGYVGIPSFHYKEKEVGLPYEYSYRQNFDANMVSLPTKHNPSEKLNDDTVSKGKPRWTVHSTLKCVDANAFWNINSPKKDTNADYENMVTTLLNVVLHDTSATSTWVNERDKEFADLGDFRERMKNALTQQQLDKICRYITVDSWGNEKSFKYGADYTNYDQELPAIFEKRYPININVASWEILTVVFTNIEAKNYTANYDPETLAKKIVEDRYTNSKDPDKNNPPFKTWNDVEDYLYNRANLSKNDAEAIFAAIYPGMLPNKKSPNKAQYRKFDKSDITKGTTECCLFSPGVFYCEAIGRVIEYNRKPYTVLAHSKVSVNMKLWEPYIVNSQSDFEWQRHKDKQKLATWSGLEGGYYPEEYPARKNETEGKSEGKNEVSAGFLQERGYWNSEDSKGKTYPDACRFWPWFDKAEQSGKNNNPFEKRPDGIYMKPSTLTNDQVVPGILEDVNEKWNDSEWNSNKWEKDGFDLWIKPSYTGQQEEAETLVKEPILIAVKKEKAKTTDSNANYYILTRCAYDDADTDHPYLTISRTLIVPDNFPYADEIRTTSDPRGFRIFFNSEILEEDKSVLFSIGQQIFRIFLGHVQKKCLPNEDENVCFPHSNKYTDTFATNFADKVYEAIMQEAESVTLRYEMCTMISEWGPPSHNPKSGEILIYLPKDFSDQEEDYNNERLRWHHATILSGLPVNDSFEFEGTINGEHNEVYLLDYVFSKKQCITKIADEIEFGKLENDSNNSKFYYGYVKRANPQKEAKELAWFPGKAVNDDYNVPIQIEYKYSRTESRIPNIKLYKGCWYHILARWEADKILLKDFKVHYKDGNNIEYKQGKLYKHLFGSPGRVWALNDQTNLEEVKLYPPSPTDEKGNKTYFYCNDCVISFSHYRTQNKAWRYWSDKNTSSVYTGNFNEGNIITGDPEKDNKFNLPKMYKSQKHPKNFYYGTVAWTQFFSENKKNYDDDAKEDGAVFKINGKQFYSWGEDKNPPANRPNSIFMKQYSNKDDSPDASFRFELHDEGGDASASHLETTIVDRVVLYMIVQPQPIHWSYNTYKDKNLYQKQ